MKLINGFLKWLALLVITISGGLLAIILLSSQPDLDFFWLRIAILLAIALIGSLASRLFFHRMPGILLFLITLITQILSSLTIDYFYESTYRFSFLNRNFTFQNPSISDLAQAGLLVLVSLPALFFLRRKKKPAKVQEEPTPPQPARLKFSLRQKLQPVLFSLNPANWGITRNIKKKTGQLFSGAKKKSRTKPVLVSSKPAASAPKTAVAIKSTPKKTASSKIALPRKSKNKRMNDVKLMGEEEHVCPYCLEKVEKSDKIVVCPECGTWHHKDCWDLTGSCGVAHRNEL
jgi:ribosomal protein L37AE/L43A